MTQPPADPHPLPHPTPGASRGSSPIALRIVEAVYLFGLLLGGTGIAAFVFHVDLPIAIDPQLFLVIGVALFGMLFVLLRAGTVEPWFVTHLVWLLNTYTSIFVAWVVGIIVMFCAIFLGGWLVYTGLALWGLAGLWFLLRHYRGYLTFRRRVQIGG